MTKNTLTPPAEKTDIYRPFNHKSWRTVLIETEKQLKLAYPEISLIGPFGFELLWKAAQAPTNIRRLYVYSNLPCNANKKDLSNDIQETIFLKILQIYPEIYNDFILIIKNDEFCKKKNDNYRCLPTDKLLDIQVRETTDSVLYDYAEYLILTHKSFLATSGEITNYKSSVRYRSRTLQLYLIQEGLYENLIPALGPEKQKLFEKIMPFITNNIQMFFNINKIGEIKKISPAEEQLFSQYILPRSDEISKLLAKNCDGEKIKCEREVYHDSDKTRLKAYIDARLHKKLITTVAQTYKNFV